MLVDFCDTRTSTAHAARVGAILQAEYPGLRPEAIRALLIHSAEWIEPTQTAFGVKKNHAVGRLRRFGRCRYSRRG